MIRMYHLPFTIYHFGWRLVGQLSIVLCALCIISSCSTTTRISDDDPLYTGIRKVNIEDEQDAPSEAEALEEMNGALAYAPNNSFFGSSTLRFPLPVGLWVYNSMNPDSIHGIKKWFYSTFSANPRTISSASPATRAKVANNVLQNYGYFNSTIDYDLITDKKDARKQKIRYNVHLGHAYTLEDIGYAFAQPADSIIKKSLDDTYLHADDQFSVANLQLERSRLSTLLHNNGYYYYRPDYVKFFADSINYNGKVKVLVQQAEGMPNKATRQWKYGKVSVFLRNNTSTLTRGLNIYDDTIHRPRFDIAYQGKKVPVRIPIIMRNFKFWTGMMYSEDRVNKTLTQLSNMDSFSNVQFTFTPADSTDTCKVLNVRLDATMDKLLDSELEFNFTQKSNSQIGPDMALTFSRRNAFRNGEKLSLTLKGSYYWQVRNRSSQEVNNIDTYEWGVDAGLEYPWTVFPYFLKHNFYRPTSTTFKASFTRTNIAKAFRYNEFAFGVNYTFKSSDHVTHTFSPLTIEVMDVRHRPDASTVPQRVNELMASSDRFVPSMSYSFTYDNTSNTKRTWVTKFIGTFKEAGNIVSGIYGLSGHSFDERDKKLCGKAYSQYIKMSAELRSKYRITQKSCFAMRALMGFAYAYGNSLIVPVLDRFYAGGAYSIRAFPARGIGPGSMTYSKEDSYLYHSGACRLEANIEYRFPLFGNLNGAVFLDAGNVWNLRKYIDSYTKDDVYFTDGHIFNKNFLKEIALGTGFGFRYDMDILVIRLDIGIALHAPYPTSRAGYYNIPRFFKDGIGINFAASYPF